MYLLYNSSITYKCNIILSTEVSFSCRQNSLGVIESCSMVSLQIHYFHSYPSLKNTIKISLKFKTSLFIHLTCVCMCLILKYSNNKKIKNK